MGELWAAPAATGPVEATVALPGSKSLTNRYLVLAALANDRSRLRAPLRSRDTILMAGALGALGAQLSDCPGSQGTLDWVIDPAAPVRGGQQIDCGLAGTVMRFLPPMACLANAPVSFDGDAQARTRPMKPVLDALRQLGAEVDDQGSGTLPFRVGGHGSVRGGEVTIDASASSQFISALLLTGARFDHGVTIRHQGPVIPSQPHISMTVETLRDAGVEVDDTDPNQWRVEPSEINALDVIVEPDLSNAGPFLAAALVTGGRVTVPGWPQHTTQAGDALRDILDAMGADVLLDREGLTVHGEESFGGIDIDLHDAAELTPTVAALAALATSPSRIRGVAHIRGHETDRLAALSYELNELGAQVTETADGLEIIPKPLSGKVFHTYADHRMAMAAAIIGLAVPGVLIEDITTTGKTLPDFAGLWLSMMGQQ